MKRFVPWWLRIIIKIIFYYLNIPRQFLRSFGLLKHGNMDEAAYAIKIFNLYWDQFQKQQKEKDFIFFELGCGDSLASGVIAWLRGAKESFLVDEGDYAIKNLALYQKVAQEDMQAIPERKAQVQNCSTIEELLRICHISYLTEGLKSLRRIENQKIDFLFSNAVLEHVPRSEAFEIFSELARILKQGGLASHQIDFRDHLGGAKNHLRFGLGWWEKGLPAKAGFYTNRLMLNDFLGYIKKLPYEVLSVESQKWEELPTNKSVFSKSFKNYSNEDLLTHTALITLVRKEAP